MSEGSGSWPWAEGTSLSERYVLEALLRDDVATAWYRARDVRMQRPLVVEVLKEGGIDLRGPGRFEQSLAALRALDHPNIASIADHGLWHKRRYLGS